MSGERISRKTYVSVFLVLWILTSATVGAAYVDLGALSTPVAMAIAAAKALLVLAFFMHLRFSNRLVWVFAAAGFLWLALLIGGTVIDVTTRSTHTVSGPFVPRETSSGSEDPP